MRAAIEIVTDKLGQPSMRDFLALKKLAHKYNKYAIPAALAQTGACGRDLSKMKSNNNTRTGAASVSSRQKSGSREAGSDGDGEPLRPLNLQLLDQKALAQCWCSNIKTIQNLCSKSPHLLPPSIKVPGTRGPRWTASSIEEWITNLEREAISAHTAQQINSTHRRPGRPRIALTKGGAK